MKRSDFLKAGAGLGAMTFISNLSIGANTPNHVISDTARIIRNEHGKTLNVLGDKMTLKLTSKDTGGRFALIEQNNEPGVSIPLHVHENEDEIFKVIQGQLEVQVADETWTLNPGDLAFCPRGVPHTWKVTGEENAKVDLSFFPAGLEEMFDELAQLPEGPPDFDVIAKITGRYGVNFL
ncbi:MAG: cupin domain-containing protein [Balneolaceae bacterium]